MVILEADGSLEATGNREEVEIEETIPAILEALEEGPLSEKEIWERVGKGHSLVSRHPESVEKEKIKRTGKGKEETLLSMKKSLSFSPQYIWRRAGEK